MKVFISHSMKDKDLLGNLKETLERHQIQILVAEHVVDMERSISDKIKAMIEVCDVGLVLLTKDGVASGFVREEIGYLNAKGKPKLTIADKEAFKEYGGFLYGHDYIELEHDNTNVTIEKVKSSLITYWQKNQADKQRRESNAALAAIGLLAFALILGSD